MKNINIFRLFLFYLFFLFSPHSSYSQGQHFGQPVLSTKYHATYYISSQIVRWTYPEESLRMFEYLMQAYGQKFCFGQQDRFQVSYENFSKLNRAIERNFPHLAIDIMTGEKLPPASLYKTVLFHIYPTVSAYSTDRFEQLRLEDQNVRYGNILYGYQLLLEKVFSSDDNNYPIGLTTSMILQVKKSLLLAMLESVKVQIALKGSYQLNPVCFPWDHQQAFNMNQMLNYLENMLHMVNVQDIGMTACDEFDSLLDVLVYSQFSSLGATMSNVPSLGNINQQDDTTSYCSKEPFISKIQSL